MRASALPLALTAAILCFLTAAASAQPAPPRYFPPPLSFTAGRDALAAEKVNLEDLPGGFVLATAPPRMTVIGIDGIYRGKFTRALWLYAPRTSHRGQRGLARVVTVHHLPEDGEAAARTARLCARLLEVHRKQFGGEAAFPRFHAGADIWLWRNTPRGVDPAAGAETRDNQVYLFATGEPRTSIEWTRTIAHEWGHLTLRGARGFSAPEYDAAGYLGERLYLKWLREEGTTAEGRNDWTDAPGLELYHTRQIAPLIARFRTEGPLSPRYGKMDAAAMDLYIGAALAIEDSLGAAHLGRALAAADGSRPTDLLNAARQSVEREDTLPVRLPAWVPLARSTYQIVAGVAGASGSIALADRPPLTLRQGRVALDVQLPGWKWVRATSGTIREVTFRRLSAARRRVTAARR